MHPLRIRQALQKWNEAALIDALRAVVVDVTGEACTPEADHDLTWACRDLMWSARRSPFGGGSTAPVGATGVLLTCSHHVRPGGGIEIRVGSRDDAMRERLIEMDLGLHAVSVPRDRIESPPWHGEPDYVEPPNPHVAPIAVTPRLRWAHALDTMSAHPPGERTRRWEAGDHEGVWDELATLGDAVRDDDARLADAMHVVLGAMERAAANLRDLTAKLRQLGLQVGDAAVAADTAARIARLEDAVGPLPLTFCAWYERVGAVDLRGFRTEVEYEVWTGVAALGPDVERSDPLVMEASALDYDDSAWWQGRYAAAFAPDIYHKFFVSGGESYAVRAPSAAADGRVGDDSFVSYLRRCFRWKGFPEVELAPLAQLPMRPF